MVWNRIWAVLSNFFVQVGCHKNLQVAIYAVDSLRQLAMKFLERDELANYSFQTLFMTPLVVVMRQSKAVEIRELIIRCNSQKLLRHCLGMNLHHLRTRQDRPEFASLECSSPRPLLSYPRPVCNLACMCMRFATTGLRCPMQGNPFLVASSSPFIVIPLFINHPYIGSV